MYADPHLSDTTRLFSTKEQRFPQISFRERHGGIAQLGERMTGSHEVSGSIPLISTKDPLCRNAERIFFVFDGQKCCQRGIPVWRMGLRRPLHVETGRLLTNRPPV